MLVVGQLLKDQSVHLQLSSKNEMMQVVKQARLHTLAQQDRAGGEAPGGAPPSGPRGVEGLPMALPPCRGPHHGSQHGMPHGHEGGGGVGPRPGGMGLGPGPMGMNFDVEAALAAMPPGF